MLTLLVDTIYTDTIMLGKVRTLLEWADELLSKMLELTRVEWMDSPRTVMTTRAPAGSKDIHRN